MAVANLSCVPIFFLLFTLSVSAFYFCIKCKFDMRTSTYSKWTAKVTSEETRNRSQMSLQEFANNSLILIFQKMTTHLWRIIVTRLQFFERKFVNSRGIRKKHSPVWNWKKKKKKMWNMSNHKMIHCYNSKRNEQYWKIHKIKETKHAREKQ